jgi:hypothetical protein
MLDLMYQLPSTSGVKECLISRRSSEQGQHSRSWKAG